MTGSKSIYRDPQWKVKVMKGQDASQPYVSDGWRSFSNPSIGFDWARTSPSPYRDYGNFRSTKSLFSTANLSVADDLALRDLALLRLKQRLNTSINRKNQLIPLVELREMRGLVHSLSSMSLEFIYGFLRILARPRRASSYHSLRQAAQHAWLTFSFGVNPTVSAIQDLANQIDKKMSNRLPSERLYGTAIKHWISTQSQINGTFVSCFNLASNVELRHSLSYRYVAGFNPTALAGNDYGLIEQFQFGLRDLPSLGWELAPLSWMFDYFSNMSGFLDDTFVSPSGFTKYVVLTRLYKCDVVETPSVVYTPVPAGESAYHHVYLRRAGFREYCRIDRSVQSSLSRVGFHLKTVDQIGKNAVSKLLNVLSLVKSGKPLINH